VAEGRVLMVDDHANSDNDFNLEEEEDDNANDTLRVCPLLKHKR
jgi:hypothetical protein